MNFQFQMNTPDRVNFHGQKRLLKMLLPEEISSLKDKNHLVLVSKALDFQLKSELKDHELAKHLQGLIEPRNIYKQLDKCEPNTRAHLRLALYSVKPVDMVELQNNPAVEQQVLWMKVVLMSDLLQMQTRLEKEEGSLTKLVRHCDGPESVNLELGGLERLNEHPFISETVKDFVWNEEHLFWESASTYQVSFHISEILDIMIHQRIGILILCMGKLLVKIEQAGIYGVLRQVYGNAGQDWRLQRSLLEEETSADFEIRSGQAEMDDQAPIKCHRIKLIGASPVFADMFKEASSWKEAKSDVVTLPESEETIRALLHFIYYGDTERIFSCHGDTALELLQAGHKYDIPTLVKATCIILKTKYRRESWRLKLFDVDQAVELFCFARNLEGECWTDLRVLSCKLLKQKSVAELMASEDYKHLYKIGEKLGPLFVSVFENAVGLTKLEYLPFVPVSVTREEASLVYDFLLSSFKDRPFKVLLSRQPLRDGRQRQVTFEIALAAKVLADFCGRPFPSAWDDVIQRGFSLGGNEKFGVDYLVKLFGLAREKTGKMWEVVRKETVQKLKWYLNHKPANIKESKAYLEMFKLDYLGAMEFCKISLELEKERVQKLTEIDRGT